MTATRHDSPDLVHRLPHARAPIDAAHDPFVGNESADDNLAECAQLALWTEVGAFHRGVSVQVRDGVITLTGGLPSPTHRDRAVKAVSALAGVRKVVSDIHASHADTGTTATAAGELSFGHTAAQPMIFVTRFCSPQEASVSAAIRQGVDELTAFLAVAGQPAPQLVHVLYRNMLPQALTVDVGVPTDAVTAARAAGDVHGGHTPAGAFLERPVGPGMAALLAGGARLTQLAESTGHHSSGLLWQSFAPDAFSPWQGHPEGRLRLLLAHASGH